MPKFHLVVVCCCHFNNFTGDWIEIQRPLCVDGLLDRMCLLQGLIGLRYSPMGQNELRTIFLKTAPWLLYAALH